MNTAFGSTCAELLSGIPLRRAATVALAASLSLGLAACDSDDETGPEGQALVQIELTDAPSDYIESAEVWISRVYLKGADSDEEMTEDPDGDVDPNVVDLFDDPENPFQVDLLVLQDGIVAELTEPVVVEPGSYEGLRIVVDSAFVTLKEGYAFSDGSTTQVLKIPSGSTSGIKVHMDQEITAESAELTTLLVDFDVNQNFKIQGNPGTPAGIKGILFTPVLKVLEQAEEEL